MSRLEKIEAGIGCFEPTSAIRKSVESLIAEVRELRANQIPGNVTPEFLAEVYNNLVNRVWGDTGAWDATDPGVKRWEIEIARMALVCIRAGRMADFADPDMGPDEDRAEAIREAKREGAREMRERAAEAVRAHNDSQCTDHECIAQDVEHVPLPGDHGTEG